MNKVNRIFVVSLTVISFLIFSGVGGFAQTKDPTPQGIIVKPPASSPLQVKLESNRSRYNPGGEVNLELKLNKKAYVYLYNIDTEGKVNLLFPNKYDKKNYVGPGEVSLPRKGYSFLAGNREGAEYLQVIASTQPLELFTSIGAEEFKNNPFPLLSKHPGSFATTSTKRISSDVNQKEWAATWTSVNVTKKLSELSVRSNPPGAGVYVANELIGNTPGTFSVKPGTRKVTLKLSNYEDWTTTVSVKSYETRNIQADLQPSTITQLSVNSTPSGADVYLDGRFQGRTPLRFFTESGNRTIRISKQGYEVWEKVVDIQPYLNRNLEVNLQEIQFSRLSLYSTPSGASVYVDGQYRGRTPAELRLRADKLLEIVLKNQGYENWRRKLKLVPNQERSVSVSLRTIEKAKSSYKKRDTELGFRLNGGGVFGYGFSLGSEIEISSFVLGGSFRITNNSELPDKINWVPKTWEGGEVLNYGPEWELYLGYELDLFSNIHLRLGSGLALQPKANLEPLVNQSADSKEIRPMIDIARNAQLVIKPHLTVHSGIGFSSDRYSINLLFFNLRGPVLNFGFNF